MDHAPEWMKFIIVLIKAEKHELASPASKINDSERLLLLRVRGVVIFLFDADAANYVFLVHIENLKHC